jgi:hypothetical protein
MSRPRLLDLFCGAGGAAMGYHRAGFDVVGVDINPQPHYPFEFHQGDAMTWPLDGFDAIHASPPCKAFTRAGWSAHFGYHDRHDDLLTPTRTRLVLQPAPWVIENVPGSPMAPSVVLCGSNFGLNLRRHRWFECSMKAYVYIRRDDGDSLVAIRIFGARPLRNHRGHCSVHRGNGLVG